MASPLTLQPDATDGKDNIISADDVNGNAATSTEVQFLMTGAGLARRGLIQFDISSIPAGSTVSSAILTFIAFRNRLTSDTCALHRITRSWTEVASWNNYDGSNAWTTAGGDFDATADATFTPPASADTSFDVTITSLVQEWVNGTTNNGFLLKVDTESGNTKGSGVKSSDDATSTNRPKLVVTYTEPVTGAIRTFITTNTRFMG